MLVYTENSIYEINTEEKKVRRFPSTEAPELRQDADWIKYLTVRNLNVGEPMTLVLENLDAKPDAITLRKTSPVLKVQE